MTLGNLTSILGDTFLQVVLDSTGEVLYDDEMRKEKYSWGLMPWRDRAIVFLTADQSELYSGNVKIIVHIN